MVDSPSRLSSESSTGSLSGQQTGDKASGLEMAPHFSGLFSQARTHSHLTTSKNKKHSLGPKWSSF